MSADDFWLAKQYQCRLCTKVPIVRCAHQPDEPWDYMWICPNEGCDNNKKETGSGSNEPEWVILKKTISESNESELVMLKKTKAESWAEKLKSTEDEQPKFILPRFSSSAAVVTKKGECEIVQRYTLTSKEAIQLAEWLMENFG